MSQPVSVPTHVPRDRVIDFDVYFPSAVEHDYFAAWQALRRDHGPEMLWTTHNGGHWIPTNGETIRSLWADTARLSNEVLTVPAGVGKAMRFIPLQQDPPEHTPFRSAVTKGFAAKFIVALEPSVTAVARELIDTIVTRGECEFVTEFAEILPIHIFLTLIGVPVEDRRKLRALGSQLTRPDGSMTPEQLRDAADDYLRPYIRARLESPGDDLFSRILAVPIEGRPWSFDEAQRMCRNLLFGGLDTVVANVGFIALHLARYPGDRHQLREDPALIPAAADEFLRRYASTSVSRNVTATFEVDGVTLQTGDIVFLASTLHNLDPRSFDDPETVRFDRKLNATRHSAMGNGPHRCVGATLARMEIIAFLREWLARMPDYRTHPDRPVRMKGGNVGACTELPLQWNT
jgi:cytochrome P450